MSHEIKLPELYRQTVKGFYTFAHRGASYYCPENTMPAFEKAYKMDVDLIELDITLSKDGVPVVFHDIKLDNKTDGRGVVNSYTFKELRRLDAGLWFGREFKGVRIPSLEEVLEWASGKISLNIEIKPEAVEISRNPGIEDMAIKLVREYGMEKHVIFSSFSYQGIERLKQIAPDIPTGLLFNRELNGKRTAAELVAEYGTDSFNCRWGDLKRSWRKELLEKKIPVFIYTINSTFWMRKLIKNGINGIFSDRPDVLRKVVIDLFTV